jgi:hypothetical protein
MPLPTRTRSVAKYERNTSMLPHGFIGTFVTRDSIRMDHRNTPKGRLLLNLSQAMLADSLSDDRVADDKTERTVSAGCAPAKDRDKLAASRADR